MTVLERAEAALQETGVDALLLGPGADLRHLTGYHALPLERLTLLVARRDGTHTLVVPTLERARAEAAGLPPGLRVVDVGETDDPFAHVRDALDGLDGLDVVPASGRGTGCGPRSCSAARRRCRRRVGRAPRS